MGEESVPELVNVTVETALIASGLHVAGPAGAFVAGAATKYVRSRFDAGWKS